jgi:hypothetical protein
MGFSSLAIWNLLLFCMRFEPRCHGRVCNVDRARLQQNLFGHQLLQRSAAKLWLFGQWSTDRNQQLIPCESEAGGQFVLAQNLFADCLSRDHYRGFSHSWGFRPSGRPTGRFGFGVKIEIGIKGPAATGTNYG